ncbi:MAG: bile acid:sodium symporter [Myxococcota bacterium]|nr:bile acid:sodium symporter [Myxococcota bacterium]
MEWLQRYPEFEYPIASTQLVLAMLGMGALLHPADFRRVVRDPRGVALGLAAQIVGVPVMAGVLGGLLPIEAGLAAGLALVASVPGGTMSNVITHLGRGNIVLSISITALTTVACLVITPILLRVLVGAHLPPDFSMPAGKVAGEVALFLLLPLAIGMGVGARFRERREVFSRWCIRGSLFAIGLMVVGAAGSGRLDPQSYGAVGLVAVLASTLAFQAVGYLATRAGGLPSADRLAVLIEVTVRNTNLALLIKASVFPARAGEADPIGDGMLFASLLYGAFALLAAIPPVLWHRRRGTAWLPEELR